jgi:DoxX-like protein
MAYWPATIMVAVLFAVPGAALMAKVPHFAAEMGRLGFPGYFLTLLGAFKVAGAVIILAPRLPTLKEWAYAGMMFDIVGAIVSHISVGDPPITVALPVLIGVLLTLSWASRPVARRLVAQRTAALVAP